MILKTHRCIGHGAAVNKVYSHLKLSMGGKVQPKKRVQYDYLYTSTSHIQLGKLFLKVMWFISKLFYLQRSFNNKYDLLHNGKLDQHHAKERVHQVLKSSSVIKVKFINQQMLEYCK